ncbi:MAG: ABC transporter ATP-binding protein [Bdellovibrionota bacterium]|nr:MAG: ABC transporter ATP-binding protein [Bdellovibrionota bacterium]
MDITIRSLSKTYSDAGRVLCVLQDLNVQFSAGNSYAIVGRSGIGKSTLLHLVGALDTPQHGSVMYGDTDVVRLSPDERARFRGKHVGFIFQFHQLLPEFTALENVAMPCLIAEEDYASSLARANELLDLVGLRDRAQHRPGELSGGEQQRVAIARALMRRPSVVLADEPTGNLDIQTAAEIQRLLLDVQRRDGMTLVVVTHSQELSKAVNVALEMQPGGALIAANRGSSN